MEFVICINCCWMVANELLFCAYGELVICVKVLQGVK